MSKRHNEIVQKQFTKTVEAFSKQVPRDKPDALSARVEFMKPQPHELALDVACGPGTLVLALARRLHFARGIDVTRAMLLQARAFQAQARIANAFFDRGDAEYLPYGDEAFHLVTCEFCFHHMPKPAVALKEMVRVTRSDGRLVVVDTLGPESDEKWKLHNQIQTLRDPSHVASLRFTTLLKMFDDLGLFLTRQSIRRVSRSFNRWMLRAGLNPSQPLYQQTRRLFEEALPGDQAGFSAQTQDGDYSIIHHEGMFWLEKTRR